VSSPEYLSTVRELFGSPELTPEATRLAGDSLIDAAVRMFSGPWEHAVLSPKERGLILLSLDASPSQLEPGRLPQRVADARAAGATDREIVAVLHLTTLMGCHTPSLAAPILYEVLLERGDIERDRPLTPEQEEIVRRFQTDSAWLRPMPASQRAMMLADTDHFLRVQSYIKAAYSATDVISPRMMHLVCIAFDAAPTHLYEKGIRIHIKQALEEGATAAEISEVLQLASLRGWRSMVAGLAALEALNANPAATV
jgi:alkylhydroperoxidase/carboxymuconolactone decarboxylase family protein YurZ